MSRTAHIERKTQETHIEVNINLDGTGQGTIKTPIGFFNHMLELLARHSLLDIEINASGDIDVDYHHLVEDTGIVLGKAILSALGDKKAIKRYGSFFIPMDETLAFSSLDISGRPYLSFNVTFSQSKVGNFDLELIEEFFRAFANSAGITLHMEIIRGKNAHHMVEALFKAFGRALKEAVSIEPRETGIPSTKGIL